MSEILQRWRRGEGLSGVLVIDGHTHVGEWPHGANFETMEEMVEGVAAVMDANGVDAACVMSGGYMFNGADYRLGNDVLMELTRRLAGRIVPFAHVNPNDPLEAVVAELERVCSAGVRCIKLLNAYQDYPGDGPNLMAVYDFADEHNMLILDHSWTREEIVRIAELHPGVDFIFGHYGPWQDPILRRYPNVYANIWNLASLGFFERGVRAAGAEKLLFGSDAFMNPISVGIGIVVYADIPDQHKRQVLGRNQARLLEKVGALPAGLAERL